MRATIINQIPILLLSLLFYLAPLSSTGQQILSALHIDGGGWNDGYEYIVRDPQGNYYLGLEYEPDQEGIQIGDTLITANRIDKPPTDLRFNDFYYIKFSPDHSFVGYFVADNISFIPDFYSSGKYNAIVLNHYFESGQKDSSYPIIIQDSITIPREGHRAQGGIILLDENLSYIRNIILSSGWLGQVVIDGEYLYVECVIQIGEPYITVGSDTVYNFVWPDGNPGSENVVLCKYDLKTDSILWWRSIGDVAPEQLSEMDISSEHNLIVHGNTTSRYFTFNGIDTVENLSQHNPFIGIYNSNGEFISGILNSNLVNESCDDYITDDEGNIYMVGFYYGPEYIIGDTILYNPLQGALYSFRPIIKKYDSQGNFIWIHQLEGSGDGFFTEVIYRDGVILASGLFIDGSLSIGNDIYSHEHSNGIHNAFLVKFDSNTGAYIDHAFTEGPNKRWFYDLYIKNDKAIDAYLLVIGPGDVFNLELNELSINNYHGHLINMSSDFTSNDNYEAPPFNFDIYPNPVNSGSPVFIEQDQIIEGKTYYSLVNSKGKIIVHNSLIIIDNNSYIKIPDIPSGIYFLTIHSSKSIYTQKLIIE